LSALQSAAFSSRASNVAADQAIALLLIAEPNPPIGINKTNKRNTMTQETVQLQIPFEALVNAISSLGLEEKRRLWQLLDEEIAQAEEDLLEEDPTIQAEIQEARTAYQTGDYQTIEEYIANRSGKTP
jgi:hypothetical protein